MPFDVAAARKDGVPEDVILQHLTETRKFDVAGALKSGATKTQIIDHLASTPPPVQKSVSERAKANLEPTSPGNVQSDRVIAAAAQDEKNLYGRTAAITAGAIPFALAAPVGATGLAAYGLMAAAGLTGGLASQAAKRAVGSNETLSGAALLNSLGIDTLTGVLSQGVAEGTNVVTTEVLPRVVEKAAAKSVTGAKTLDSIWDATRTKLFDVVNKSVLIDRPPIVVSATSAGKALMPYGQAAPITEFGGGPLVDVGPALERAMVRWKAIPRGADALGKEFGSGTARDRRIFKSLQDTLDVNETSLSALQPLGGLINIRSGITSAVRESGARISGAAKNILGDLATDLDKVIVKELHSVSPEAVELYQRANQLGGLRADRLAVVNVAEKTLWTFLSGKKLGAAIGAAAGFRAGGYGGAIAGAAGGAAMQEAIPAAASWALQRAVAHPEAAKVAKEAIRFATLGREGPAQALMARAFALAGVRDVVKQFLTKQQQPQSPPLSEPVQAQPAPQ
jgi:hypothetical protein